MLGLGKGSVRGYVREGSTIEERVKFLALWC